MITSNLKREKLKLLRRAGFLFRRRKIRPVATCGSFEECYTITGGYVIFWFDTEDNSSHIVYTRWSPTAGEI